MSIGTTFAVETTLRTVTCGICGGTYAIQERYRAKKYEEGGGWHCPYCQTEWGYFGKTEAQRLREEKASLERELRQSRDYTAAERARHDQTKARLRAQRGVATKLRKHVDRVEKGVCPQCNRSFEDLRRHMKTCHGCGNDAQDLPNESDALAKKKKKR